jgi:hypothetical protein
MEDKENKNWLAQTGQQFTDADFVEAGLPKELMYSEGLNRSMLDSVHAQNVASYVNSGMNEQEAKMKADKQRSLAIKAAKANGLTM